MTKPKTPDDEGFLEMLGSMGIDTMVDPSTPRDAAPIDDTAVYIADDGMVVTVVRWSPTMMGWLPVSEAHHSNHTCNVGDGVAQAILHVLARMMHEIAPAYVEFAQTPAGQYALDQMGLTFEDIVIPTADQAMMMAQFSDADHEWDLTVIDDDED